MSTSIAAVRDFVRAQAKVAPSDDLFSDTVDLLDYGYIDSFGIVGLIELMSSKFGVDLANVDFYDKSNRTIAGIAAAADARIGAKS